MKDPIGLKPLEAVYDTLMDNRAMGLEAHVLAGLFDRLIWCLSDNGASLAVAQCKWMDSDDLYRVKVALLMSEVCPFTKKEDLARSLDRIMSKFPDLVPQCHNYWKIFGKILDSK